jgi:hypothetical protein
MRSLSAPILSLLLIMTPALGSPHIRDPHAIRKGGDDGGNSGSGSGIPTVDNAKNPLCKPWYAIRDAIMGGIYHGMQSPAYIYFILTGMLKGVAVTLPARLSG